VGGRLFWVNDLPFLGDIGPRRRSVSLVNPSILNEDNAAYQGQTVSNVKKMVDLAMVK